MLKKYNNLNVFLNKLFRGECMKLFDFEPEIGIVHEKVNFKLNKFYLAPFL